SIWMSCRVTCLSIVAMGAPAHEYRKARGPGTALPAAGCAARHGAGGGEGAFRGRGAAAVARGARGARASAGGCGSGGGGRPRGAVTGDLRAAFRRRVGRGEDR